MKHVLIIEPNRLLSDSYRQSLELIGLKTSVASGAQEAIDCADNQMPDIVLLELQLADHSGLEFLHEFRSYADWQQIPVIVNSNIPAHRVSQNRQYLQQLGIRKVLYKPTASLKEIIREVRVLI